MCTTTKQKTAQLLRNLGRCDLSMFDYDYDKET